MMNQYEWLVAEVGVDATVTQEQFLNNDVGYARKTEHNPEFLSADVAQQGCIEDLTQNGTERPPHNGYIPVELATHKDEHDVADLMGLRPEAAAEIIINRLGNHAGSSAHNHTNRNSGMELTAVKAGDDEEDDGNGCHDSC